MCTYEYRILQMSLMIYKSSFPDVASVDQYRYNALCIVHTMKYVHGSYFDSLTVDCRHKQVSLLQ